MRGWQVVEIASWAAEKLGGRASIAREYHGLDRLVVAFGGTFKTYPLEDLQSLRYSEEGVAILVGLVYRLFQKSQELPG